jgi:metallo-beta-lactamase class B
MLKKIEVICWIWRPVMMLFLSTLAVAKGVDIPIEINRDLVVVRIANNIWQHISYQEMENYGRVPANGLIVVDGKDAALIDTPWTNELTTALCNWVTDSLKAKIDAVVLTHSHNDCMGGLEAAHRLGAASYAHEKTILFAQKQNKPVPQTAFADSLNLTIGGKQLSLFYVGAGHTADNIVVWLPADSVLFGGCLVKSAEAKNLGYTGEADLVQWPKTIEALLKKFPQARLIVSGHGRPGGLELLRHTLDLLGKGSSR